MPLGGVLHLRRIHRNRNSVRMKTQVDTAFLLLQLREESFWPTAGLTVAAGEARGGCLKGATSGQSSHKPHRSSADTCVLGCGRREISCLFSGRKPDLCVSVATMRRRQTAASAQDRQQVLPRGNLLLFTSK